MTVQSFMADSLGRKIAIAVGASVGFHVLLAGMVEMSLGNGSQEAKPQPVMVSRIELSGSESKADADNILNSARDPEVDRELYRGVEAGIPIPRDQGYVPPITTSQNQRSNEKSEVQRELERMKVPRSSSTSGVPTQRGSSTASGQAPQQNHEWRPPIYAEPPANRSKGGDTNGQSQVQSNRQEAAKSSRGANRGAIPIHTEEPRIPSNLVRDGLQNHVFVKVDIEPSGSFSVELQQGCGSTEIDNIVLAALRRWKWDPAAQNGVEIRSTETFKYVFKLRQG